MTLLTSTNISLYSLGARAFAHKSTELTYGGRCVAALLHASLMAVIIDYRWSLATLARVYQNLLRTSLILLLVQRLLNSS